MNANDRIALVIGRLVIQTEQLGVEIEGLQRQIAEKEAAGHAPKEDKPA